MAHTEQQSVIYKMNQRAEIVLETINAGLLNNQFFEGGLNKKLLQPWEVLLNQLERHHHLSIQMMDRNDQQTIYFPQRKSVLNLTQNKADWLNALFSVDSLVIEKKIPQQLTTSIIVIIEVEPIVDVEEIRQRIFTFLSLMILLAVLVYATIKILTARFQRELDAINIGIRAVENGHYLKQLPDFYYAELTRISETYNQAAEQLEKRRRENQTLAERLLWLQEEERQFLAQELHDELGQSISAIKVMCVSMQKSGQASSQQSNQGIDQLGLSTRCQSITDICDHLYTVVRDLMKRLRPTVLDEVGLKAALEEVVNTWRQGYDELEISLDCDDHVQQCNDNKNINIYRIVQESLTNTVKHAEARHIDISLREYHDSSRPWAANTFFQLDIIDDGKGFNTTDKRFGYGLVGMRERVKSMGGKLEITSSPGVGTSISVQIPRTGK